MVSRLHLDYEAKSRTPFGGATSSGLYNYCRHQSTKPLMVAYKLDDGGVIHADIDPQTKKLPPDLLDALTDPHVEKWAFNAAFERVFTRDCLGIETGYQAWRCLMVASYHFSFAGGLEEIGTSLGLPAELVKDPRGKQLIKKFCVPQRITKKNPMEWCDQDTHPEEWGDFQQYNKRDVITDVAIYDALPMNQGFWEWDLYALDQRINDYGLPVNLDFCNSGLILRDKRFKQLSDLMRDISGLDNPNSTQQLLPWLKERGYRFSDLGKDTVKKELREDEADELGWLDPDAIQVMKLRLFANQTSPTKYRALQRLVANDGRLHHVLQMGGAGRTNRWAGRSFNSQNLKRPPDELEVENGDSSKLDSVIEAIALQKMEWLEILVAEPMNAIAGCVRSAFQAEEDHEFVVADLSSIESVVIAYVARCNRMLQVFRDGRDSYKDFGTVMFNKKYEDITKKERKDSKPAVLGAGYGLGGGAIKDGKRTGLWGYAENMGVDLTQEFSLKSVRLFRQTYSEIPDTWKMLDAAVAHVMDTGQKRVVNDMLLIERNREYLTIKLPSGRKLWYFKPRMVTRKIERDDGTSYESRGLTYMGNITGKKGWYRVNTWGGKLIENVTQAISRDILVVGMMRADEYGFNIAGHVHDEIITHQRRGSNVYTVEALSRCMADPIEWLPNIPLGAAGYNAIVYRKD